MKPGRQRIKRISGIGPLAELRVRRGLMQSQVADRLEVHVQTIYQLERGRMAPNLALTQALAKLYRVQPREIINAWERIAVAENQERAALLREELKLQETGKEEEA